jgi:hypothetical protein
MIEISELPKSNIVKLSVGSDVSRADFACVLEELKDIVEEREQIRLLEEVQQVPSFDPSMIWEDLDFSLEHLQEITHCAVISNLGWVGPFARIVGAFSRCQIRVFTAAQKERARDWLNDAQ